MYEEIHIEEDLKNKLGMQDYNHDEFRTLSSVTIVMKNGGFALYSQEEVYFVGFDSELRSVKPMIKANFQINKSQMYVERVCPSPDPSLLVISMCKGTDYLLLVWNVEENREVYNFSTNNYWTFFLGPKTKAGYIFNGEVYTNLDYGLINYFFEYTFTNSILNSQN